jgi:hypothetical protein
MPIATLNNAIIRKDGKLAERCECCPCRTKWSDATAIEVEIEMISDYRETVGFKYAGEFNYATQQMCPDRYTGTFSLTKVGRSQVANFAGPLFRTSWRYDFGNGASFRLEATDDWNGGINSTWVNLSWSISVVTLASWQRVSSPIGDPYPPANDLCSDSSITTGSPDFPAPGSTVRYAVSALPRFSSTAVTPPQPIYLDSVQRICKSGPQVSVATTLINGVPSEVVTPATIYEIWQSSLMSDLATSGVFRACDFFRYIGCVELLHHSPAGIYGFRKIGTFQVNAINLVF